MTRKKTVLRFLKWTLFRL